MTYFVVIDNLPILRLNQGSYLVPSIKQRSSRAYILCLVFRSAHRPTIIPRQQDSQTQSTNRSEFDGRQAETGRQPAQKFLPRTYAVCRRQVCALFHPTAATRVRSTQPTVKEKAPPGAFYFNERGVRGRVISYTASERC